MYSIIYKIGDKEKKMDAKKTSKIFIIIILLFTILFMHSSNVFASSIGGIISGADDFLNVGKNETAISDKDVKHLSDTIYNILLILGTIIATIVGIVLAIQFITGSLEQKAKIKETLIAYLVGCVVIFGAFGIWTPAQARARDTALWL